MTIFDGIRARLLRAARPLSRELFRVAPGLSRRTRARQRLSSLLAGPGSAADVEFIPYGDTGIEVAVTPQIVSTGNMGHLRAGTYERPEAISAEKLLSRREIVVELGSGVGLISSVVMKTGRAKAIHCFEADPRLVPLIQASHARNGIVGAKVYNAAVTADPRALRLGHIAFHVRKSFMESSVMPTRAESTQGTVNVPACSLSDILRALRPTILLIDIEGAEAGLFRNAPLGSVKRIAVEVHPRAIGGRAGVRQLFEDLHAQGFAYDTKLSAAAVPVFSRI